LLYCNTPSIRDRLPLLGLLKMYNVELVRKVCEDINEAKNDSERELELLYLLQAVMNDDPEQVRMRTALLNENRAAVC
jgi:hypothetical protein